MQDRSTVFVVDSDAESRAAVGDLVRQTNLRCIEYDLGQKFVDAYDPSWPGCLVVEVRMPDIGGLQIQRHLAEQRATLPVIFLTAHGDTSTAVRAMQAGALQFLEKPFREHELWDAIQEALALDLELRREWAAEQELAERMARLTPKELEVLEGIADGKSNKVISEELDVCARTIELRRASLMKKLEVGSLTELLQFVGAAFGADLRQLCGNTESRWANSHQFSGRPGGGIGRLAKNHNSRKAVF